MVMGTGESRDGGARPLVLREVVTVSGKGKEARAGESQSYVLSPPRLCLLQDPGETELPTAKSMSAPGAGPWEDAAGMEDQNS